MVLAPNSSTAIRPMVCMRAERTHGAWGAVFQRFMDKVWQWRMQFQCAANPTHGMEKLHTLRTNLLKESDQ